MSYSVALILLYDEDGRFLLQHRTSDAAVMPGYWAFFGGGLKEGETPEAALYRETFEELNYTPKVPRLVHERDFEAGRVGGHMYVFMEAFRGDKSDLRLQEGQGWGWFRDDEINGLLMIDHDREVVRFAGKKLRNEATRALPQAPAGGG